MSEQSVSRRDWLKRLFGYGSLGGLFAGGLFAYREDIQSRKMTLNLDEYERDGLEVVYRDESYWLVKTDTGVELQDKTE